VRSLLISLAGIFVLLAILDRSLHWAAYCVLPCTLAVAATFSVLGRLGIPLGVATSVFAGITLGIGVDFAIHLAERYRRAVAAGRTRAEALIDSLEVAGPAILVDGLVVSLGFSVLCLSEVPANARLGGIALVAVLTCLAATFVLVPALVSVFPPRGDGTMPAR
jgi:predicted RND superfamily exporter protein